MSTSEQKIEVLERYSHLHSSLNAVCDAILVDALPAWMSVPPVFFRPMQETLPRPFIVQFLKQLEYFDEQEPREIIVCPGFFAASAKTIQLIHELNAAKDDFKASMIALKGQRIDFKKANFEAEHAALVRKRPQSTAYPLTKMGLARLHLKQCYRKIPVLPYVPKKISWTWANTRSIKRISALDARHMLERKKQDQGILAQLNALSHLSPSEPLAIVQELAPHLRANLLFNDKAPIQRMMVKGPVPLVYEADASVPPPHIVPIKPKQGKNAQRIVRKDAQIDPNVFLPAIRAHRYLK